MLKSMFVAMSTVVLMVGLAAGCAGPSSLASGSVAAAVATASDLAGTWYGTFGQVAASLYADEGKAVLEIKEDGTFTASITRGVGTNNLAKPATWAGTVVTNGNRVTLRNSQRPWPWIVLSRSGNNILYGLAHDPAIGAPVMMKFERGGTER